MPSPSQPPGVRSRSRVWPRVIAALVLIAGAVGVYSITTLGSVAADKSPVVTVSSLKDGRGHVQRLVRTSFQHEHGTPYTSLRLENKSTEHVRVALAVRDVDGLYPGTLTSTLTASGTDQISGALDGLRLDPVVVAPHSQVVIRLTFDGSSADFEEMWATNPHITAVINVLS